MRGCGTGAAGAVASASATPDALLAKPFLGSLRSKTRDGGSRGLLPLLKGLKPKLSSRQSPAAALPQASLSGWEQQRVPRSLPMMPKACLPHPATVAAAAAAAAVTAQRTAAFLGMPGRGMQWRLGAGRSSALGTSFRLAGGLFKHGNGQRVVGAEALDVLRLARPGLQNGGRRVEIPVAGALNDKPHGPTSPGGGGESGKPQKLSTKAIPIKSGAAVPASTSSDSASSDDAGSGTARVVLERLFAQAHLYDPEVALGEDLEAVMRQLEMDLGQVLGILRCKEELVAAEAKVQQEREEVEAARAVLVQREQQLEATRLEQVGRQDELVQAKHALKEQRKETERVTVQLRRAEADLVTQREEVRRRSRELQVANMRLVEQKGALSELEGALVGKQRDLGDALEQREQQRLELVSIQAVLARQREEHRSLSADLDSKRQRLETVERDLSMRTQAFGAAREEIQTLQMQLQNMAGVSRASTRELQHAQALLVEVQEELRASNHAVAHFQAEVKEQEVKALRLEAEMSRMGLLLQSRERELAASAGLHQAEVQELHKVQRELSAVQKRVKDLEREAYERQQQLEDEKAQALVMAEELSSLKRETRQQSAALSDLQLSLQVKQAELLTTRLEMQQLRSDLSAAQLLVNQKTDELEAAQRAASTLQAELTVVKRQMAEKEEQLAGLGEALVEKDRAISLLRGDVDSNRLKLSEAEHALEQIAQLSYTLADTARQNSGAKEEEGLEGALTRTALLGARLESPEQLQAMLLSQANEDLVAVNSALLELDMKHIRLQDEVEVQAESKGALQAELEAVQECLREKELQLEMTREQLLSKEGQLQALLRQWEVREHEMGRMRDEVLEGAREISALRDMARASGLVRGWVRDGEGGEELLSEDEQDDAAITKLELEVAKLEADSAIAALRALSDLSVELKEGCCDVEDRECRNALVSAATEAWVERSSPVPQRQAAVLETHDVVAVQDTKEAASPTVSAVAKMEEQLREKDAALSMAKQAMENLAELTRRLVMEASAVKPQLV